MELPWTRAIKRKMADHGTLFHSAKQYAERTAWHGLTDADLVR